MIDNHPEVHEAHESDDLLFGTVESWVVWVRLRLLYRTSLLTFS